MSPESRKLPGSPGPAPTAEPPSAITTTDPDVDQASDTTPVVDAKGIVWRRSSTCFRINGKLACVEVSFVEETAVVRDGKYPDSPGLVFGQEPWEGFIAGVVANEFDLRKVRASVKPADANWIRSSWSTATTNNHVEVAFLGADVAVRDSDQPDVQLIFTLTEWTVFIAGATEGEFDF